MPDSSIAAALQPFFFDLTDEQRRALQGEEVAGVWWRKMKRGKQRIYLLQRDGRTYIHLLQRRDWVHANDMAGRFKAA